MSHQDIAAYQLLGTAILGIIVKTWPGLAILTIGGVLIKEKRGQWPRLLSCYESSRKCSLVPPYGRYALRSPAPAVATLGAELIRNWSASLRHDGNPRYLAV